MFRSGAIPTSTKCDDLFTWSPPYDFAKETDSGKTKLLILYFVGTNKMFQRDTAIVKIYVKDALDYPYAKSDYETDPAKTSASTCSG